jgi:hypothetical protein
VRYWRRGSSRNAPRAWKSRDRNRIASARGFSLQHRCRLVVERPRICVRPCHWLICCAIGSLRYLRTAETGWIVRRSDNWPRTMQTIRPMKLRRKRPRPRRRQRRPRATCTLTSGGSELFGQGRPIHRRDLSGRRDQSRSADDPLLQRCRRRRATEPVPRATAPSISSPTPLSGHDRGAPSSLTTSGSGTDVPRWLAQI